MPSFKRIYVAVAWAFSARSALSRSSCFTSAFMPAAKSPRTSSTSPAANIAGAGVAGRSGTDPAAAIHVQKGGLVNVAMSASSPISQLKVKLAFAGFGWTVKNGAASGNSWTRTLKVTDYASWGVGLYQVSGVSTGAGLSCTGTVLVRVAGNPLATVAGGTALGLSILGVVGLLGGALRGRSRVGAVPVLGLFSGLFLGVGILTLLQQYGTVYPPRAIALAAVLVGVLFGLFVPAMTHALSTGHIGPWHFHHHPAAGH